MGRKKTDIAEFVVTRGSLVVAEVLQTACMGNKIGEENFALSSKSRLDILQAASVGD